MKRSRIYTLLVALSLAGFPLIAGGTTFLGLSSTSYSIAMRAAIIGLSALLLVMAVVGNTIKFVRGTFWLPILVFWFAYLLRIYVDTTSDPGSLSRTTSDYWIWAVGACLIPMLGLLTYCKADYLTSSYKLSLIMLALASVFVVLTGSGSFPQNSGLNVDIGRLNIQSLNPISVGHLGVSLLLLSIWPFMRHGRIFFGYKQILFILTGFLGLYLLLASASRGPFVAFVLIIVFYLSAQNLKRSLKILILAAILVGAISQLGNYLENSGGYRFLSRSESTLSGEDKSVAIRQLSYMGAADQFIQSPLFGDSLEEKETRYYPHNVILESFMATGLIGGLPFIFVILFGTFISYTVIKTKSENGWVPLIFMQYLIAAQFSGALYTATTMWAFLGATIVLFKRNLKTPDRLLKPTKC